MPANNGPYRKRPRRPDPPYEVHWRRQRQFNILGYASLLTTVVIFTVGVFIEHYWFAVFPALFCAVCFNVVNTYGCKHPCEHK